MIEGCRLRLGWGVAKPAGPGRLGLGIGGGGPADSVVLWLAVLDRVRSWLRVGPFRMINASLQFVSGPLNKLKKEVGGWD